VIRALEDPLNRVFLVGLPDSLNPLRLLSSLLPIRVLNVELDLPVNLIPSSTAGSVPDGLLDRVPRLYYGSLVWNGYAQQPASDIVRLHEAHSTFGVSGGVTVAVIDTGVDPTHPGLLTSLVPGYDFTRNLAGPGSEMADVNQSTAAVVDGGGSPTRVNNQTIAVVNQSTAAVVDDPSKKAFGHGTMAAGIIHLTAPTARIMPLKTFRADGTGNLSDIIRAVYFAARSNARVINMSFSTASPSQELERSLDYATSRQIVCVSSAGNDGSRTLLYPAGLPSVMGVGATDNLDRRSWFSNYGDGLVWVAAPGEAIISTYPYGSYAAAWGTSFSTPFVSGAAALLLGLNPGANPATVAAGVAAAKPTGQELGNGRLDIVQAAQRVQGGN
jgi:subtilisin family serine protease